MQDKFQHIELFAGCGGMSLGLEAADFELYFANELSPMASETFSYNILDEDLSKLSGNSQNPEKTLWIKSHYKRHNLLSRLRENPFKYDTAKYTDIDVNTDFKGKLLVGNINHFLTFLNENESIGKNLKKKNIDLISGGPPCQSFSLAGKREKDNHKNSLPLSFAQIVGIIQPKTVLLENVKGITSPFTVEGKKYYAWVEVAKAFCLEGFVPICMMINSKYFGIPQNRPRFILLALRLDIYKNIVNTLKEEKESTILANSYAFFEKVLENKESLSHVNKNDLKLYDIEKEPDLFNGNILPSIITNKDNFISAIDAIDDLSQLSSIDKEKNTPSGYVKNLNNFFTLHKNKSATHKIKNHEYRKHGFNVRARFRWLQIISKLNGLSPYALKVLSGDFEEEKMKLIFQRIQGEQILVRFPYEDKLTAIKDYEAFVSYIKSIQTRKHSQRAIKANEPAPAQLTIPDDLCHYSSTQLRTLTVREMARFQSFPDWFEFKSKATTGGINRSFEVPQYTQVGNAVPPLLAYQLGTLVKNILKLEKDVK